MAEKAAPLSHVLEYLAAKLPKSGPSASNRRDAPDTKARPPARRRPVVDVDTLVQHFEIASARRATAIRGPLPYRHLRAQRILNTRSRRAVVPTSFIQSDPTFSNPWWTKAVVGHTETDAIARIDVELLDGRVVEQLRRELVDSEGRRRKEFVAIMPDGSQVTFGSIPHRLLPLYAVKSLDVDGLVIVTEGAKAADALRERGFSAVGTLTGALGTPSAAALEPLRRRHVVLWPDNDEVGVRHMQRVARRLAELEPASLKVSRWVGAPRKADAADFVGDMEAIMAVIDAATEWSPRSPVGGRGTVSVNTGPPAMRLSLPGDVRPALGDR